MAGSEEPEPSPPAPTTLAVREVSVAEKPSKKICHGLGSTSADSSERHVWADITDSLLHLIIVLFTSFHDFLAVTSTCRSWRAAVSSFPPLYYFPFPPLLLEASLRYARRHLGDGDDAYNPLSNYQWQLRDPAKTILPLYCSPPRHTPNYIFYVGCSYGYVIFSCREHCLLVDVYTSTKVKPPKLECKNVHEIYYGILTAPLSSPSSHLLLCSRRYIFHWQVGANPWTQYRLVYKRIHQIVSFKGQIFAMETSAQLSTISLAPQLGMQEVAVVLGEGVVPGLRKNTWLVVCGDMLLMVDIKVLVYESYNNSHKKFCFQVFHLDLSAKQAMWVKVEKLENWALFVSIDRRSHTFSCMTPERWGGKSNYIYVPSKFEDSDEPWIAVELGQQLDSRTHPLSYILSRKERHLENFWVLPSLVYGVSQ